jgi:NitT/TauT family transport system substrate-binding protein
MKKFVPALALLAGFISQQALAAEAEASTPIDVTRRIVLLVDEIKAIRNFPLVVAERLGYLKGNGMDVTVMNIRDDVFHDELLMDGRIDAVMAYYHHNIVNQSKGNATQAIVTLGVTPGAKVLVANQVKDKYRTAADLKGSRIIAGGAGSSKTTVANYLVLEGGYKLADYTRLGTEGKDKNTELLRSGAADLIVAPTPDYEYYEGQGLATTFADLTTVEGTRKYFGTVFPSSTIFMASERIKAHPEMAQHLADAMVRALKYINTHSAEEIAALIPAEIKGKGKEKDKEQAAYLKLLKQELPMFANDGRMPVDGAEKEWRVLAEFNPGFKSVKVGDTYTNKFVEAALQKYR